jgi:transposase
LLRSRRSFYEIHQATGLLLAEEVPRLIGELYAIENEIRGRSAEERHVVRRERRKPLLDTLHAWLTVQLGRIPGRTKAHEPERLLPQAWQAEQLAAAARV